MKSMLDNSYGTSMSLQLKHLNAEIHEKVSLRQDIVAQSILGSALQLNLKCGIPTPTNIRLADLLRFKFSLTGFSFCNLITGRLSLPLPLPFIRMSVPHNASYRRFRN